MRGRTTGPSQGTVGVHCTLGLTDFTVVWVVCGEATGWSGTRDPPRPLPQFLVQEMRTRFCDELGRGRGLRADVNCIDPLLQGFCKPQIDPFFTRSV